MSLTQPNATLSRLDARRKRHGITLAMIAIEAAKTSKTKTCSIPTVSAALSGDEKNANVIEATKRLVAAAVAAAKQSTKAS